MTFLLRNLLFLLIFMWGAAIYRLRRPLVKQEILFRSVIFFKDVAGIRDLTIKKKVITRNICRNCEQFKFSLPWYLWLVLISLIVLLQNWVHQIIHNALKKPKWPKEFYSWMRETKQKNFSVVEFPNFDLNHFQFMNTFKNIVEQMLSNGKC